MNLQKLEEALQSNIQKHDELQEKLGTLRYAQRYVFHLPSSFLYCFFSPFSSPYFCFSEVKISECVVCEAGHFCAVVVSSVYHHLCFTCILFLYLDGRERKRSHTKKRYVIPLSVYQFLNSRYLELRIDFTPPPIKGCDHLKPSNVYIFYPSSC